MGNTELMSDVYTIITRLNSQYNNEQETERVEFIMEDHGLGTMPSTVSTIGSILLFNSSINPYKNYQALDNLLLSGFKEKSVQQDNNSNKLIGPAGFISGDVLPDIQALDLLFKPSMGEMSNLALPENLPLDFIASKLYDPSS